MGVRDNSLDCDSMYVEDIALSGIFFPDRRPGGGSGFVLSSAFVSGADL